MLADNAALIGAAFAVSLFVAGCLIALNRTTLIALLVLLRSISDLGATSASGHAFPSTEIAGTLGVAAIIAAILPSKTRLSGTARTASTVAIIALLVWSALLWSNYGFRPAYASVLVQLLSIVALFVLAYRAGIENGAGNLPRMINITVGIPAVVLISGYLLSAEVAINTTGRATGGFAHANAAGAYFAVGAVAAVWGYSESRRITSLAVAFAASTALLLTQSLGALAALACGATFLFALNSKISPLESIIRASLTVGIGLGLLAVFGPTERLDEFENVTAGAQAEGSVGWRFKNWSLLMSVWRSSNPFFGTGLGSTTYEINPLGSLPHSVYVQLLVETGIIGVLVATSLVLFSIAATRRRFLTNPKEAAAISAICITVLLHASAANWLGYIAADYLLVFVVGLLVGATATIRQNEVAPPTELSKFPHAEGIRA